MNACPDCHRLRTPNGLHICLREAKFRRLNDPARLVVALWPKSDQVRVTVVKSAARRVGTISLPGDGPAAVVWNALVRGGGR